MSLSWNFYQKIWIIRLYTKIISLLSLNKSTLLGWKFSIKNIQKVNTRQINIFIAIIIILTLIYLILVLFFLKYKNIYYSFWEKIISDFIILVTLKSL